jgi:hypothetical protein
MSKNRFSNRVDSNQNEIVKVLRSIPGVTVEVNHDDLLCGFRGVTYWFEIKTPDCVGKDGNIKPSKLKKSQVDLLLNWTGHYEVVWDVEQILEAIGIN